mmetsp:Transcript_9498/g.24011  ORF Transcript_9498/g.24011 Transcript_9498/m.24011 type:complete len:96 (-) Transcript_9498:1042-1329(-)
MATVSQCSSVYLGLLNRIRLRGLADSADGKRTRTDAIAALAFLPAIRFYSIGLEDFKLEPAIKGKRIGNAEKDGVVGVKGLRVVNEMRPSANNEP